MQILTSTNVLLVCSIKTISTKCVMNLWNTPPKLGAIPAAECLQNVPQRLAISTWARVDTFSSDLNALLVCFASDIHWISGVCINWNQHSILTSDPNWVQVRLHIQNPIWLAVNHLLFNGNPLRFWGVHVPAMFQPLIPRTLIKNLDDSLQAQFAKSNPHHLRNNKPPKIIQTLRFFWGRFWGVLGGWIPFPPVFVWGGKTAKSKVKRPPWTFHPCWEPPTKPAASKTVHQDLYKKWGGDSEDGITKSPTSFWWEKNHARKYDQRWVM